MVHLEKVSSEHVLGQHYDVWDVHTDRARWWVVTPMMNLYGQDEFKSMDYVLSFHIGLMERLHARQEKHIAPEDAPDELDQCWRRYAQATDALDQAHEAEDFQAVGMRLRECLISFVREMSTIVDLPEGCETPQAANFPEWAGLLANTMAAGKRNQGIRKYLRELAVPTWQLVQQLTHSSTADFMEAEIARAAVAHLMEMYTLARIRLKRGEPTRCPECGSYKIASDYRSDEQASYALCSSCGWEELECIYSDEHEQPDADPA
ncbi:MAG: hypothetical protein KKA32_08760 [Actinobacteria bacterium]|nr:hypothetical protein [Actinomycetota bacterium]